MPHYQSAHEAAVDAATLLLARIASERTSAFTGTGIIFYEGLTELAHLQLISDELSDPPIGALDGDLSQVLLSLSEKESPWHDGFHFVDAKTFELTHVAQFVSPPIPQNPGKIVGKGARFMTAMLSSLVPGITCVGLVSQDGRASVFENGALIQVNSR